MGQKSENWSMAPRDLKKVSFPCRGKCMPPVRLELTAFRLWDWRAAYCATEAVAGPQAKTADLQFKTTPPVHLEQKVSCQKWDSNSRPQTRTRNLIPSPIKGTRLKPWVWRLRPLGHPDTLATWVRPNVDHPSRWGEGKTLAERGFDPRTSGLWAQHASTAPLCCISDRYI